MDTRSEELARAFAEGRISEADYLSQLQTLGRDVSLSLGLGIDESAYSTDVTSAAEEHRARLVEIDRNANQERITAYQEWAEKDEELRTTYREEQALALEEDRQVEMQKIRDAYAEELADLIAHNKDLEEEEIRHLREGREIKARQMAEIDSIAEREIEELRAKNLPLAEEVAEYERIIADAERRRRVIESIPEDLAQHEGEDWGADFGSSSSEPTPQSSQRLPQNPKEPPKLPPRKDPPALPSSPRSAYGARLQPVSIVVNNNNPVVDTPERERRLAQQTREQVRATLDEWTSDALLRGRLG
jgi:flagellar biosynthesis GTPase FlhF